MDSWTDNSQTENKSDADSDKASGSGSESALSEGGEPARGFTTTISVGKWKNWGVQASLEHSRKRDSYIRTSGPGLMGEIICFQTIMTPSAAPSTSVAERKSLIRGVYVPVLTFFHDDQSESLDLDTFSKHIKFVATAGCAGVVVLGSTGERVALTEQERCILIKSARETLDTSGFKDMPLIAGAGDQSVQLAVASVQSAAEAGASHVLVLPSSYYPSQLGRIGASEYYTELANKSPLPILVYSYPGVCSGITLDSELINELARHPNIRGVKHTDHDIGKMARHCALAEIDSRNFFVLGGASDYFVGALAVGAQGTITGLANIAPRTVVEIQKLWDAGHYEKARALQAIVSCAEWELGKGGVPIHKALVQSFLGYGGRPRRPLQASGDEAIKQATQGFSALMALEKQLESRG